MTEVQVGVLLLAVVPLVWLLMWRGWRSRVRRQHGVAALPAVPDALHPTVFGPVDGTYAGTTTAESWLDRVVAGGLGARSAVTVTVHGPGDVEGASGVLLARHGAPDVWLGSEALRGARLDRGIAGKVVGARGLVVLEWTLGDLDLDTGVRLARETDRVALADAVASATTHGAEGVGPRG